MDLTWNLFLIAIGAVLTYVSGKKYWKRTNKIDSCGNAKVSKVVNLGRQGLEKVYAVYYEVTPEQGEPFEIIDSPVNKPPEVGKVRQMFYESQDHNNRYFKTIGMWDRRIIPCLSIGALTLISVIACFV